jgi:hypothetical protein
MKNSFWVACLILVSSCGLRYVPQETPQSSESDRRALIEETIQREFKSQNKTYTPIGYGETVTIKPVSYLKLDSLFAQKYNLEKRGKSDANLEEAIKMQQIVCKEDTNQVLYLERHVFTLTSDTSAEILSGDFYIGKDNYLKDVKFTESYHVDKDYINYYSLYVFEQPFLGGETLTTDEKNFYTLYKAALQTRTDKDAFLNNTLKIMQIAYYKRTLDTQTLLKELTRKYVHNNQSNYSDEVFVKIEQVSDGNQLIKYVVQYQSVSKTTTGFFTTKQELEFDPYLMLLSKKELPF